MICYQKYMYITHVCLYTPKLPRLNYNKLSSKLAQDITELFMYLSLIFYNVKSAVISFGRIHLKYVGHKCLVELHHSSKKSTTGFARVLSFIEYFKFISSCSGREAPRTTQSPLSPSSLLWWYIHRNAASGIDISSSVWCWASNSLSFSIARKCSCFQYRSRYTLSQPIPLKRPLAIFLLSFSSNLYFPDNNPPPRGLYA